MSILNDTVRRQIVWKILLLWCEYHVQILSIAGKLLLYYVLLKEVIIIILISACLLGVNCKYDGKNNLNEKIVEYFKDKNIIPVCPEQLGGLSTPRLSSEIKDGDGRDVLEGTTKVMNNSGSDVTGQFIKGAYETLKLARTLGVTKAVLKARSPSCGVGEIYNGNFNGTLIEGDGVTAALLKSKGIEVYDDGDFLFYMDEQKLREDICND